MLIPTLIHDNFFRNYEEVINYSKQIKFFNDEKGAWPGKRSLPLHQVNKNLFDFVTVKIIKLIWPSSYEDIYFTACSQFQSISKNHVNPGWVHKDDGILTAIIYLSEHKECGTSIFESKNFNFSDTKNGNIKRQSYINQTFKNEYKYLKENNDNFEETISIQSKPNRIVIFDSHQMHAAHKFTEKNISEDRLTLITFFSSIHGTGVKWHGPECFRD